LLPTDVNFFVSLFIFFVFFIYKWHVFLTSSNSQNIRCLIFKSCRTNSSHSLIAMYINCLMMLMVTKWNNLTRTCGRKLSATVVSNIRTSECHLLRRSSLSCQRHRLIDGQWKTGSVLGGSLFECLSRMQSLAPATHQVCNSFR